MNWPILILATISSVLVAIACFRFGVRKLVPVGLAQMGVSFGVSYAVAAGFAVDPDATGVIWTCLIASVAIPATWAVLTVILGPPLERRRMSRDAARAHR